MQRVYSSPNLIFVGQLNQLLKENHIRSYIKNEHLAGGIGELPAFECWPELWVIEPDQVTRAAELIEAFVGAVDATEDQSPWDCANCGETIEASFGSCWNCGADRPLNLQDS